MSLSMVAAVLTELDLFEQAIARHPLIVAPETPIPEVIASLERSHSFSSHSITPQPAASNLQHCESCACVLIVQNGCLVGIVTPQDIEQWQHSTARDRNDIVAQIMTTPVITLQELEFTDPFTALAQLHRHQIQHLPILSATHQVIGVVTAASLLKLAQALSALQQQTIQSQATQLRVQAAQAERDRQQAEAALQRSETQFQQTFAALQHSESKHRTLIDTLPDLIMRISRDGRYLDFFPSKTFKVLGSVDLVGQRVLDGSLPLALAEKRMEYIHRALESNCLQIYEQQLLIDDKLRTEEVRVMVSGNDEVLLIVRDITDRKQVEAAIVQLNQDLETKIKHRTQSLKESEERFRQIFEQSPLGIAITDLDGYVVRANSRLLATLGYTNTPDVIGLSIQELLCVEPTSQGLLPLQQLLEQTLSVISFESQPITKEGKTRWVNVTSALIFSSNFPSAIIHLVEDITDRKQIEQQLRHLSDRLTLAVQAGEIGIWEWDIATNELVWDGRMCELYGIQAADFTEVYTDWIKRVHPADQANTQAAIEKALQQQQEFNPEFRILHPDGTIRFIKAAGLIRRDHQGIPQRMTGVNFDITNHKQAQAVIAQYAHEVEDLYNNAPCGYHSVDYQGRLIKINNTSLHWLGYSREEVLGRRFDEFLTPKSREAFQSHYASFKRHGMLQDIELDLICKDNTIFPVLLNATAVKDADGTYLYSRSTLFDHRQLKTATNSLKRQLVAIEAAVDGIAILDQQGYIYLNRAHLELFGYEHLDELIGKNWTVLYLPEDIDWLRQEIYPHLQAHGCWQGEAKAVRKDGSTFIQGLSLTLTETGEIVCVCRDITQQKHAEEQLRQINERLTQTNTELHQATRLKDEFLANMSHELRTPLNAILGMAEGLQERVFGELNPHQKEAMTTIAHSGSHLLELINDILDLSKAEACRLELQLAPTSIWDLCYSSLALVKHQAQQKNLHLLADVPQNLPDIVLDERRIRQVLINLLTNAVKFTSHYGTIQIIVRPESQSGQEQLRFSVIDTGIGIAPDDLHKLFQPFFQVDSSLNRCYTGTGLGLALVRRLVELHQGTISTTSTLGQGSCFSICLPYIRSPLSSSSETQLRLPQATLPPPRSPVVAVSPAPSTMTITSSSSGAASSRATPLILLAEDNEANIITTTSYLNARGYHTILARNGVEAVSLAATQLPDLILMDIQMPEMDGLEAIKHIRRHLELEQIPIIALTALAMLGDRDKCLAAGANDYCTKPIKLKQLVGIIRGLLNQNQPLVGKDEL
ncbi:MAG: PAS domain S-box protein [Leptolyngbyaceae cyanobacterium bins.349]|nr:PAS domain S-box protein [Leptolyngbyaceae cyanobacterium bins.349]